MKLNWKYVLLLSLVFVLSPTMKSDAQIGGTLRLQNSGTILNREPYLNFVNGGCVDNAGQQRTDCTFLSGASFGNWTFSGNNADLSGAGAMGVGVGGNATSVVIGPTTLTLATNTNIGGGAQAAAGTNSMTLTSNVADGASSNGFVMNESNASLSGNNTRRILSVQKNGVEQFIVNGNGNIAIISGQGLYPIGSEGSFGLSISSSNPVVSIVGGDIAPSSDFGSTSGDAARRWGATFTRHLVGGQASVPTCAPGTGAGSSGSPTCAVLTHGTDLSGILEVVTATAPAGSGAIVATVTLNTAGSNKPFCNITPAGSTSALIDLTVAIYVDYASGSTSTWVVKNPSATGLTGTTTYDFSYTCTDSSL